ncbi:MAG: TetR/AcrR family transcriptional regulator [Deltaproteobacteria bacterium]|nr:TetR/AcrR family transcriptional regulator [Deltaproteobacteria bacterium]
MARKTPPDRLPHLVACATQVFIDQGYRRTQMDDVAAALGVAKGTLYLYVASKEALFDLVIRHADEDSPFPALAHLPLPTPAPEATLAYVRERLARNQTLPTLTAALARQRVTDARAELALILEELYDTLARNRHGIKLLDRSAHDQPELAALWFDSARGGLIATFTHYLKTRMDRKRLRPVSDAAVGARLIIEAIAFWAVHRHWDPHPQVVDETVARDTVIQFLLNALTLKEDA